MIPSCGQKRGKRKRNPDWKVKKWREEKKKNQGHAVFNFLD
jgi:ribosomal protein L37E